MRSGVSWVRKVTLVGAALAVSAAGLVAGAAPAAAAEYNGVCGDGYAVVNQRDLDKGTVYLTYNNDNGNNCVVTIRDNPGKRLTMFAGISRESDSAWYDVDQGEYTTYAGPVYRNAPGECVTWGGTIDGDYDGGNNTNCG